jgi:hypothetical protein
LQLPFFNQRTKARRYYAALQELVIIDISNKGYHYIEYDDRFQLAAQSAAAQAVRKARGGSYTISCLHACPHCPAARVKILNAVPRPIVASAGRAGHAQQVFRGAWYN